MQWFIGQQWMSLFELRNIIEEKETHNFWFTYSLKLCWRMQKNNSSPNITVFMLETGSKLLEETVI